MTRSESRVPPLPPLPPEMDLGGLTPPGIQSSSYLQTFSVIKSDLSSASLAFWIVVISPFETRMVKTSSIDRRHMSSQVFALRLALHKSKTLSSQVPSRTQMMLVSVLLLQAPGRSRAQDNDEERKVVVDVGEISIVLPLQAPVPKNQDADEGFFVFWILCSIFLDSFFQPSSLPSSNDCIPPLRLVNRRPSMSSDSSTFLLSGVMFAE